MKWFLGILLLLFAALVLESGLLAFATYTLLGLLLVSRFLARNWIVNLRARRTVALRSEKQDDNEENWDDNETIPSEAARTTHAEIGDRVVVRVTVRNTGITPVPWVLLEDLVPAQGLKKESRLKVKGKNLQISMLRSGGETSLRYQLECLRRGYYQIGPLVLEGGDLFGLHRRYRVQTKPNYLVVYPTIVSLQGYELSSRRPIGDVRLMHRLYEDPTRIAGVRPYEPGDPLNRVHWRATARTGTLHSKITEPSTLTGSTIVLDFHAVGYPARGEPHRSELAVTTAISLANAVYEMGQQIGLVTNGGDAADRLRLEDWKNEQHSRAAARRVAAMAEHSDRLQPLVVETRRGVEQLQRMRELLARVELLEGLTFAQLIDEMAARLPRDATVVAVLPQVPVATALTLGNLRRRGFAVTVVLILLDETDLEQAFGRLLAEGVRDIRHLNDEAELPDLCNKQVQRSTPYQFM
jgi:uncharacterized repeat protein (TIGR01451 family)